MTKVPYDLVVIGSAFAGSLTAMIARRLGRSVLLVERGRHPRFAIGESSTPLANLLLEELVDRYDLPRLRPFSQWGTWQATYPEVGAGLKRGFTFYHHDGVRPWTSTPDRSTELLVAASPHDAVADTHWYRPDFDHFWVREAESLGVDYVDATELTSCQVDADGVTLTGTREGKTVSFRTAFVIDASGPRGFLARTLALPDTTWPEYPETEALFSHFTDVTRWDTLHPTASPPPYPPDDAALHHVFPGGWMWVLRFAHGITSAGVSVSRDRAAAWRLSEGAPAWERVLGSLPSVAEQFAVAGNVRPWQHLPRMAYRAGVVTGPRWALLPSAGGFVDPLLSTGFPLTLLGVQRLMRLMERHRVPSAGALAAYGRATHADLDAAAALIGTLHRHLHQPRVFQALTMLYFAAASFTETARRLGHPERAPGFLLRGHPTFGPGLRNLLSRVSLAEADPEAFAAAVAAVAETVNVAGLCRPERRNWYPVDTRDLLDAAGKVEATPDQLRDMLRRCGVDPVSV